MLKENLLNRLKFKMNGKEIFEHYTSFRDHSGSEQDEYAQLLETLFVHLLDDLFNLLEQAEQQGKVLALNEDYLDDYLDEYTTSDVLLISK